MSAENKALVRRWIEEVWNQGNLAIMEQIIGANFAAHDPSTQDFGRGPRAARSMVNIYRDAFPDLQLTIEDMIAEEEKVVIRWTASGTYKHGFRDNPPTGRRMTVTGISIYCISSGKIAELWSNWDFWGLTQQLGMSAMPAR